MRLILAVLLMQGVAQASVWEIVTRLRNVETRFDDMIVPTATASDLTSLKHALRDLISATVANNRDASPEEVETLVISSLGREDVPVGDEGNDGGTYGVIAAISLERPKEYRDWLVASVTLDIMCGNDTSLYVFARRSSGWQLVMSVESNGYDEISGAQGWLRYRVGLLENGTPFLVTTDHNPWCTSVWQSLRLKVLQVGSNPDHPVRRLMRSFEYCIDEPPVVSIRVGGFGLLYLGNAADQGLAGFRGVHYAEYSIKPGAITLVSEAAFDPYYLVRRWSRMDPGAGSPELNEWRERLRQPQWSCGLDGAQMTVGVASGREVLIVGAGCDSGPSGKAEAYVLIEASPNGFRIASVSSERPDWFRIYERPTCTPAPPGETHPIAEQIVQPELPDGIAPGDLSLKVVVEVDGTVRSVSVPNWPDHPGLIVPAIRAVRQWKFKPGTRDGCLVPDEQTVDVVFQK